MHGERSTRVGFVVREDHWLGGKNYLRNLFAAIATLPEGTITPVIFTGSRSVSVAADFPGIEVVGTPILDYRRSAAWFLRRIVSTVCSQDHLLRRLLERHSVSILSHAYHLGIQTSIPTIGWIPDFQHIHLPEFFSPDGLRQRNQEFLDLCLHCDRVIVSSECARGDLESFAPNQAHKAALLRFVANPVPLDRPATLEALQRMYRFEERYFLLPNQFWAHKNHRVVISALQILKRQSKEVKVLCTGMTTDYRHPTFFSEIMQYAKECEVLDSFRVLGPVPFDHLVGLMRHSIAFINPSRFEGWSTSVEEAKSMGKQILLSDIPVHREQAPERGLYFCPNDPEALAEAMAAAYNQFDDDQDRAEEQRAAKLFPARLRGFGEDFQGIIAGVKASRNGVAAR